MGGFEEYKPAMAMVGQQAIYAVITLFMRASLLNGLNPIVYVFYRQAIATSVIAPIAYFSSRGKSDGCSMGLRSFSLVFISSFIGVALCQNMYTAGIYFASSSMGSAMANLLPAITFIMASCFGLEKVNLRSWSSLAKIFGTIFCVGGALSMSLLRGPKLLNSQLHQPEANNFLNTLSSSGGSDKWLLGCLLFFGSSICWSLWLILQVPLSKSFPNHLSLSAWQCLLSALQAGTIALFSEKDPNSWILHSALEIFCCLFAGIAGSSLSFFLQAWCISKRGPLFSAMFNPLATVMVTILAATFLHEQVYTGGLVGAVAVIVGLYIVLWGKAKDLEEAKNDANLNHQNPKRIRATIREGKAVHAESSEIDLEEPLLNLDNF